VFCISTSAPPLMSAVAASVSFGGIEPVADPHHLGLDLRVHRLRAQREAVDVAHHLGIGIEPTTPSVLVLVILPGDHAGHVGAFVGAAVVGAQVLGGLVAGGVLELHVLVVGATLSIGSM
jgi:hypothetical protein